MRATLSLALLLAAPLAGQMSSLSLLPEWLPTEAQPGAVYVGSRRCVECHALQASALTTAMGDALHRLEASSFLAERAHTFSNGPYRYRIADGVYTVSDGRESLEAPIVWSVGHGKAGQTYILRHDGRLYESRVSYYMEVEGLEQTMGAPPGSVPADLDEALGRPMTPTEIAACFGCHSTGAVTAGRPTLENLTPGIQCEGCHGAGAEHVEAVADAGGAEDLRIESLRRMTAERESEFCGSCHRTWSQVMLMDLRGPANVRFQPYRLANSRCYAPDDERIRCSACHDPHANPVAEAGYYDGKCLACHERGCTVGTEDCTTCHMPKVRIPGAHYDFTDHQIRIARPADPYPD